MAAELGLGKYILSCRLVTHVLNTVTALTKYSISGVLSALFVGYALTVQPHQTYLVVYHHAEVLM